MNAEELAQAMLDWGRQKRALDELGAKIEAAVLELGKTQTVGSVRASYSKGRKSYNYLVAFADLYDHSDEEGRAELDTIKLHFSEMRTDWRGTCKEAGITYIPFTQGEPSVSLKLTE